MEEKAKLIKRRDLFTWFGFGLIIFGIISYLELQLHTGWLVYMPIPISGAVLLISGIKRKHFKPTIWGILITSIGAGLFFLLSPILHFPTPSRLGALFVSLATGWLLIFFIVKLILQRTLFWAFFLGMTLGGIGICFLFSGLKVVDFVLYIGSGIGFGFLTWGYARKMIGLIIPGCLITSTALGVYLGWNPNTTEPNALARTGVMLVILGIGWALITLLSKKVYTDVIWWPLIPALVISVTGWGLYIGGNPSQAGRFIGNTGSITLVILGAYVLLLRQGFNKE